MERENFLCAILLVFLLLSDCSQKEEITKENVQKYESVSISGLPYHFHSPKEIFILPHQLVEISGLAYHTKTGQLIAVNDERGNIYSIDKSNGQIIQKIDFGKRGDYEGVAIKNDNEVYITNSKGTIFQYDLAEKETIAVLHTELDLTNDIEGLAYDSNQNRLLLTCKGSPSITTHPKQKENKAIYSYDLEKKELDKQPFLINDKLLVQMVRANIDSTQLSKKQFKNVKKRAKSFAPSGIDIHPITKEYYMVSSHGKLLVVVDEIGTIKEIVFLDEKIHVQPEGITFSPQGDLYISNEGHGGRAKLVAYAMQK